MTPERILLRLYDIRKELELRAIKRFELDFGPPYTSEMKEIDEQIAAVEKQYRLDKLMFIPEANPTVTQNSKNSNLYLDKFGNLWREPKSKYCYPIGEKSDRHKIVRYLATHRGYQYTSLLSSVLNGKNEQSIRIEIGKIRKNIKRDIKIKGKEVIEGKKESGYRINPKCKVTLND